MILLIQIYVAAAQMAIMSPHLSNLASGSLLFAPHICKPVFAFHASLADNPSKAFAKTIIAYLRSRTLASSACLLLLIIKS